MSKRFQKLGLAAGLLIATGVVGVMVPVITSATAATPPVKPASSQPPLTIQAVPPQTPQQYCVPSIITRGPMPLPQASPPRSNLITNPCWSSRPAPEYPERALSNSVNSGRAQLRCAALPNGALSSCNVILEAPAGMGFGQAALLATRRARLSPQTVDEVADGGFIQFTIYFAID